MEWRERFDRMLEYLRGCKRAASLTGWDEWKNQKADNLRAAGREVPFMKRIPRGRRNPPRTWKQAFRRMSQYAGKTRIRLGGWSYFAERENKYFRRNEMRNRRPTASDANSAEAQVPAIGENADAGNSRD